MRLVQALFGLLLLSICFALAPSAQAVEVSLFNGLPHGIEVIRMLPEGAEQRPWSGPMEPGSRWRLRLPVGSNLEFRRDGQAVAVLQVGREARQGHVIRLPGVKGPVPPPPPRGMASEFPNWRRSTAVRPAPAPTLQVSAASAPRVAPNWRLEP